MRNIEEALTVGEVVANLLAALSSDDVIFIARDEPRAVEVAKALAAGAPDDLVLYCPGSDALPGENAPPSPSNVGQRTTALRRIRGQLAASEERTRIALVTTGEAAARLYPSPHHFDTAPPVIRTGDKLDLPSFAEELESVGYIRDDRVDEPGELALRGQVIDVYPADAGEPYRIQAEEGRISSIRRYDAGSQLTIEECERLQLGRASEPALGEGVSLLDHLPAAAAWIDDGADKRRRQFLALAADAERRAPNPAFKDICSDEQWRAALSTHPQIDVVEGATGSVPRFVESRSPLGAFASLARETLASCDKVLLVGTERDLRFLARRVAKALSAAPTQVRSWAEAVAAVPGALLMLEMPIAKGFRHADLLVVAAADLLGSRAQRATSSSVAAETQFFELGEIRIGDVVVHEDHGVCVVAGLERLPGEGGDAIVLRFAGESRRLVAATEANKIWRYGSDEEAVSLDKLDGSTWMKRRADVSAKIAETAQQLVQLSAERLERTAPVFDPEPAEYERFVASFPFTETADQARAIEAVQADLRSGSPMDRLVVGDVGYGKTEVALRAAALVALSGAQVAIAAPTTVLARQHLETFQARFAQSGLVVAGLSRLASAAEKKRVVSGLKDGSIQVVVGTGAVAGKGVRFSNLGLVIVDEEQKFGAADKAKLHHLGAEHVLTLSATPIPRTLQSALVGLQQISVIASPPARRQPIRTSMATFAPQNVRTALLRERSRGGQSFVVVPRIEDMAPMAEELGKLAPELNLLQAHGKLPGATLDETMVAFARGEGDVLLATNIIEAGLDVPRANTMIVWKADRFGLSQLHQLRGRVGRGARRGQFYLLTAPDAQIASRTVARLKTLQAFDGLGAGFAISARDLDMRGAGDLLSDEQTGHMKLIGVDLYQHLLQNALREARGERVDEWTPVIHAETAAHFPADWISDEDVRVGLYVRLARIDEITALEAYEDELVDRFGDLPQEAEQLLAFTRVRMLARLAKIERIDVGPAAIAFTPRDKELPSLGSLQKKGDRWLLSEEIEDRLQRLARAESVLSDALVIDGELAAYVR
ncbi:helicase-related protein [Novosphingobium sp. RD2P27]|uniref:Transcription-repair-coupling factor n=1 Tax=Novosphingobium kalidii TaxID=3230299 RepID=A0ABV2CY53_9SPHN